MTTTPGRSVAIYDSIGGADAVAVAVDQFYDRVLADPDLVRYFSGTNLTRLKAHQRAFIAAAIGGSEIYRGRSMKDAHAGLHVQPAHFDKVVAHLVDTLTALGVPEEVIAQIGAKLGPLRDDIAPAADDTGHGAVDEKEAASSSRRGWFRLRRTG